MRTGGASGDRVTLLSVNEARAPAAVRPGRLRAIRRPAALCAFPVACRAIASGRLVTGTETDPAGIIAEAALPIRFAGRVAAVIVYSAPVSDIVSTVTTVRHEILVAGAIALALALIAGYWWPALCPARQAPGAGGQAGGRR